MFGGGLIFSNAKKLFTIPSDYFNIPENSQPYYYNYHNFLVDGNNSINKIISLQIRCVV